MVARRRTPRSRSRIRVRTAGDTIDAEIAAVWDANATFWDEKMGEGNLTHRNLVLPSVERLLEVRAGTRILEVACGNGQLARSLATAGAQVVATDLSERMLDLARARSAAFAGRIEYRGLNAADPAALRPFAQHPFDAVVCSMALMDMSDVGPLARALPELLRPGGRFVFAVTHPCFNTTGLRRMREETDEAGTLVERAGVFVYRYATPTQARGLAMIGQPQPQWYFDRPLHALLRPFFEVGLALDGLEEPQFPPTVEPTRAMSTIAFPEIPPVLAGRMRLLPQSR